MKFSFLLPRDRPHKVIFEDFCTEKEINENHDHDIRFNEGRFIDLVLMFSNERTISCMICCAIRYSWVVVPLDSADNVYEPDFPDIPTTPSIEKDHHSVGQFHSGVLANGHLSLQAPSGHAS